MHCRTIHSHAKIILIISTLAYSDPGLLEKYAEKPGNANDRCKFIVHTKLVFILLVNILSNFITVVFTDLLRYVTVITGLMIQFHF